MNNFVNLFLGLDSTAMVRPVINKPGKRFIKNRKGKI